MAFFSLKKSYDILSSNIFTINSHLSSSQNPQNWTTTTLSPSRSLINMHRSSKLSPEIGVPPETTKVTTTTISVSIGTTLAWTKHGRLTGQDEARKRL
ncbi:hypothetical protein HanRHA438_Chr06g0262431 [Helianthus annuus]|nr:hypothetical protein HanRHA438_Chr06g0262431 [Helianthus annuus]